MKLYASPYGGKRYHRDPACIGLNSTCAANGWWEAPLISRRAAAARGLTPCLSCKPPPLLTVVPPAC